MASSSSSHHYDVAFGPLEDDLLWMQKNHVSQHIWNGANDRTLKIRRATPLYNHREAPPEEIIPLLQIPGLYPIMKLAQLKVNGALVHAFIERWRPETHTFHLKCGEATITLQDVSVLLGIPVDGRPLIGNTNIDWFELFHELLGVMSDDAAIDGNSIKLSWLSSHFANIHDFTGNQEGLERFARAWILRFIGGVMFVDKSSKRVHLKYLQFLRDLRECSSYAWGAAVLGNLYREMCIATDYNAKSIGGFTLLIQLWAWERCPTLAPSVIPPQQQNVPLGYRWLGGELHHIGNDNLIEFRCKLDVMKRDEFVWVPYAGHVEMNLSQVCFFGSVLWTCIIPLICFQKVEWHQPDRVMRQFGMQQPIPGPVMQPNNIHDLTLKGKEGKNWMRLMQPALNEWNSRYERRVEQTPPQTETLGLNSEYMRWYRRKTKVYVDPKHARRGLLGEIAETLHFMVSPVGRRVSTFDDLLPCIEKITLLSKEEDRILEAHEDAPPSQPQFEHQQFNILRQSVETRGLARRRETVDAATYSLSPMPERQHGMYYTPPTFTQEPSQMPPMYSYPHDFQPGYSFAGIFGSSPSSTETPSFTQSGQVSTPNAPLAGPWNVPGDIPDMDDLLGVDLRHDFSAEADQVDERANPRRRNPDRAAKNWDRPCGTSSRHHRHSDD
ncbi:Serine/threonine-protein phosphatase 7 long form [Glycine max]|nr:Serine/threonine-protein phosphatase 7 long form [Glycine max]